MKIRHKIVPALLLGALLLAGCGKDAALTAFHDDMNGFYESLSAAASALEGIDPSSETAADQLLSQLDQMDVLFQDLAAIEVPADYEDQFGNIEELADEAASYMTEAGSLYHEAYEQASLDESLLMAAEENYSRAMKRVNYIAQLLQGQMPEGDNITVIESDDDPDWTGGDLEEDTAEPAE